MPQETLSDAALRSIDALAEEYERGPDTEVTEAADGAEAAQDEAEAPEAPEAADEAEDIADGAVSDADGDGDAEQDDAEQDDAAGDDADPAPSHDADAIDAAIEALVRNGTPYGRAKRLAQRDPDTLIEMAADLQAGAAGDDPGQAGKPAADKRAANAPEDDVLRAARERARNALGGTFSRQEAEAVDKAVAEVVSPFVTQARAVETVVNRALVSIARAMVQQTHPAINDKSWPRVEQAAEKILRAEPGVDLITACRRAADGVLRARDAAKKPAAASSVVPPRGKSRDLGSRPKSMSEAESRVVDLILSGKTAEEANEVVYGSRRPETASFGGDTRD